MATVECVRCQRKSEKEQAQAEGWTIVQKAAGKQGNEFILCNQCKQEQVPVKGTRKRGKHGSN